MYRRKYLVVGFLVLTAAITESGVAQEKTSANLNTASIDEALFAFLTAFDNLDWQAFRTCFSSTATVFHPAAPNIRRIDSPDQFEKAWRGVFERIKKSSGRTSPPYMNLNPLDLRVERLSEDVALVTFHLVDGRTVNRRTLVFKRDPDGWKIVHIHASNISVPLQNVPSDRFLREKQTTISPQSVGRRSIIGIVDSLRDPSVTEDPAEVSWLRSSKETK